MTTKQILLALFLGIIAVIAVVSIGLTYQAISPATVSDTVDQSHVLTPTPTPTETNTHPEPSSEYTGTPSPNLKIISPKGGEVWIRDTTQKISWTDSNTYIQAEKYDISIAPYIACLHTNPRCMIATIKPYTIASKTTLATDGLSWNVGKIEDNDRTLPDGIYTVTICMSGGINCVESRTITIRTKNIEIQTQ